MLTLFNTSTLFRNYCHYNPFYFTINNYIGFRICNTSQGNLKLFWKQRCQGSVNGGLSSMVSSMQHVLSYYMVLERLDHNPLRSRDGSLIISCTHLEADSWAWKLSSMLIASWSLCLWALWQVHVKKSNLQGFLNDNNFNMLELRGYKISE